MMVSSAWLVQGQRQSYNIHAFGVGDQNSLGEFDGSKSALETINFRLFGRGLIAILGASHDLAVIRDGLCASVQIRVEQRMNPLALAGVGG